MYPGGTCRPLFRYAEGLVNSLRVPETVGNGGKQSVWKICNTCLAGKLCIHAIRVPQSPCQPSEASCSGCRTKSEQMTVPVLQILHVMGDKHISRDAWSPTGASSLSNILSSSVLSGAPQHSPRAALRSALSIQIMQVILACSSLPLADNNMQWGTMGLSAYSGTYTTAAGSCL